VRPRTSLKYKKKSRLQRLPETLDKVWFGGWLGKI
jgi:hypothetical protein